MSGVEQTSEVDAQDIIRIVLQYLLENGLMRSMQCLQEETGVSLNAVDSKEQLASNIRHGNWDRVVPVVSTFSLPDEILFILYEQIVCEMIELRELDTARLLLRETSPLQALKLVHSDRVKRLEQLLIRPTRVEPIELYEGSTKEKRRHLIAQSICNAVREAPPSRLLSIVGQAMRWQRHTGLLHAGTAFDVFEGVPLKPEAEPETAANTVHRTLKYGEKNYVEAAVFTPDGLSLIVAYVDGIIEVLNPETGKLRKDLDYQNKDMVMLHSAPVLALAVSRDSEMLASCDKKGMLKVWRLATGQCVKSFAKAHDNAISSVMFSVDGNLLLTAGFDSTARIHGLKSGKTLRVFRGHTSFVNAAVFSRSGNRVVTSSADGHLKVWDAKSTDCLATLSPPPPPNTPAGHLPGIINVVPIKRSAHVPFMSALTADAEVFLLATESHLAYAVSISFSSMSPTMNVLRTFSSGKRDAGGSFVATAMSSGGEWIYCAAEDRTIYIFSCVSGQLEHVAMEAHEKDVIGIAVSPLATRIATFGTDGFVNFIGD